MAMVKHEVQTLHQNPRATKRAIKDMLAAGHRYTKISEHFTAQGYVNTVGKPLTTQDVSYFMVKHGFRLKAKHSRPHLVKANKKRKYTKRSTPGLVASFLESAANAYLQDVEDIVTSNLAPHLKERMLKALTIGVSK